MESGYILVPDGNSHSQATTCLRPMFNVFRIDGMSYGARLTLAVATAIASLGFLLTGLFLGASLPRGAAPDYVLAIVCLAGSMACMLPRSRPVTLRIVCAAILAAYSVYVYSSIGGPDLDRSLKGFVVYGLPSAYLLIRGTWPNWGYMSPAFTPQVGDYADPAEAEIIEERSSRDRPRA